jgi:hypothetical protein
MADFNLAASAQAQSEAFIAESGGLPEIWRAATDLRAAFDTTWGEIANANFASRFVNPPSDTFGVMIGSTALLPLASQLVEEEGEAGMKRASLEAGLTRIQNELFSLLNRFVELRCDLIVSQDEMKPSTDI